jgi:hypothetical protein
MGTLTLTDGLRRVVHPLAASALVGRGWPCAVRLEHPAAPLYWLELRWMEGLWAWRPLSAELRTRGAGAFLAAGWRELDRAGGRPARLSLAEDLWIELTDPSAPVPYVSDLETGLPIDEDEALVLLEVRADGVFLAGAEGQSAAPLADGQVVRAGARLLRAHVPGPGVHTVGAVIDLGGPDLCLDIDLATPEARLSQGGAEVRLRGAGVGLLAAYSAARRANMPTGGWLSPAEALVGWAAHGGPAAAPLERVAWQRAKLRAQLARAGVAQVDALFEVRHDGDTMRTRLRLR